MPPRVLYRRDKRIILIRNGGRVGNTLALTKKRGGTVGKSMGVDAWSAVKTFEMALCKIQCLEQIIGCISWVSSIPSRVLFKFQARGEQ